MVPFAYRAAAGLAALVIAAGVGAQQVYRYTDADGRVVYSDRPPPADVKDVQTKRLGANFVETSEPGLQLQQAIERFPVTLFTFECGDVCQNAEGLLNKRGVPFTTVNVQNDAQGLARMKALTGEERVPVLALGEQLIVRGYSEARWQAALDEAGYPKGPPPRRGTAGARPAEPAPVPAPVQEGTRSLAPPGRGGDYPKE